MAMQSERLDRRITLQRSTDTQDEYGSPVKAWADLATVWANYKPVSDGEKFSERLNGGEVAATLSARFAVRYDSAWADLNPKDRLIFEGRLFDIANVKEVHGRRAFLEITASERTDD